MCCVIVVADATVVDVVATRRRYTFAAASFLCPHIERKHWIRSSNPFIAHGNPKPPPSLIYSWACCNSEHRADNRRYALAGRGMGFVRPSSGPVSNPPPSQKVSPLHFFTYTTSTGHLRPPLFNWKGGDEKNRSRNLKLVQISPARERAFSPSLP